MQKQLLKVDPDEEALQFSYKPELVS